MTSHEITKAIDLIIDLKAMNKSEYHNAHLRSTLVYLIGMEDYLRQIEIDALEAGIYDDKEY